MQSKAQSSACTSAWAVAFAFCGIVRSDYACQDAQGGIFFLTVDEELSVLEDQMRRLKVEYDIYFGGGSKKPPADIEWKVKNLLRKMSDGTRMSYSQRFRFSTLQQRYALYNTQWQQKLQIKEEGYRRPQDAMLGIQGLREEQAHEAEMAIKHHPLSGHGHFKVSCSDADAEPSKIEA